MAVTIQAKRMDDAVSNENEADCRYCLIMRRAPTDIVGSKVSQVIMNRVSRELHAKIQFPEEMNTDYESD